MAESDAHLSLKRGAVAMLARTGCMVVGYEVASPVPRWRIDVAGYHDGVPRNGAPCWWDRQARCAVLGDGTGACTIFIECKAARGDFLKDSRDTGRLLARREELASAKSELEERIIRHCEPDLRLAGQTLFPELDAWEFGLSRLPSYRKIIRELESIDEQLHGQTKFSTMARYSLADRLYIAAPRGTVLRGELPPGWGLLEAEPSEVGRGVTPLLSVRSESPEHRAAEARRLRVLRNIALAGSRGVIRRAGVVIGAPPVPVAHGEAAGEVGAASGSPAPLAQPLGRAE